MINQGFTKFEVVLGLAALSIAVLVMLPPLQGGVEKDRAMRAWEKAESIAWAVSEYHEDTGKWPETGAGSVDLSLLTQFEPNRGEIGSNGMVMAGATGGGANALAVLGTLASNDLSILPGEGTRPWLQEIPLDSWDRPFNIYILGQNAAPDARTVVVISSGPDGILQTNPKAWSPENLAVAKAGAEAGARFGAAVVPEGLFLGDDLGFILAQSTSEPLLGGVQ
jgi:hypothetical protein